MNTMNTTQKAALLMSSLSVYRGLMQRTVVKAFYELICSVDKPIREFTDAWGHFFSLLCERGCAGHWAKYLTETALYDDNAFSRAAASGKADELPDSVRRAVQRDLSVLYRLSLLRPATILSDYCHQDELGYVVRELPRWENGQPAKEFFHEETFLQHLADFYRHNGCGMFARYRAFIWRNGNIEPVPYPDSIDLSSLKSYQVQRQAVTDNTVAFLQGVSSNNCLLYGDRGTGKSSTVKALLNAYAKDGLRMVEMPKDRLGDFPLLIEKIAEIPLKFILFIDDLSFSSDDKSYAQLKAVLEGGLAVRPANTLIYATSNRRHIVKESFAERNGDDIHVNDTIQETLSLSDRFGLAVNFSKPTKEQYIEIVEGLAAEKQLSLDHDTLIAEAEQFAIGRGGRSPRCAIQFIAAAEAKQKLSSAPDEP
ncbi:MAG: ATP-binding protein [Acutalibacteraceae bacterium]|nr:ATP-binding protein [Acutalibacteraceae bacterium]